MAKRQNKEEILQQTIISYFSSISRKYNFIFFSPMSEGVMMVMNRFRIPKQAQYMMNSWMGKMGFLPGVSDIIIGFHGRLYCMELKTDIGKQSKGQLLFESNAKRTSIEYEVVRSFEECQNCLHLWGIL